MICVLLRRGWKELLSEVGRPGSAMYAIEWELSEQQGEEGAMAHTITVEQTSAILTQELQRGMQKRPPTWSDGERVAIRQYFGPRQHSKIALGATASTKIGKSLARRS